jgi:hypothetical protein
MFKKKPTLKYESLLNSYPNTIVPAKNHIPNWYKKIPQFKNNTFFSFKGGVEKTVKTCFPFLDTLTTGYMIVLPYDIYIKKDENNNPAIVVPLAIPQGPRIRPNVAHENLIPFKHYPFEFTWNHYVSYTFPKGYSFLLTHPLNRHDLPFTTLSGIVDGGIKMDPNGNIPFYLKENFEGIIEQGTPIAQLIPFRQENWKSIKTEGLAMEGKLHDLMAQSVFKGWYKNNFWKQKKYD